MNKTWHLVVGASLLGATLGFSGIARAESLLDNNWRQRERPNLKDRYASPQSFAFETRFGSYLPEVDEEFAGTGRTPFKDAFGDDRRFYFGIEVDWLPLRIPYLGAFGPGIGWGYTKTLEKARITGCTPTSSTTCESDEDTSLSIMPMHLSLVFRADELMRKTQIPIVPYGKFGLGLATWSASLGDETSDGPVIDANGSASDETVKGEDTTWGTHAAVGVMLALDWMDREAAANLDATTGINHAYVFGEWMWANLDGIGSRPQMHVGSSTWVLGLAFDM